MPDVGGAESPGALGRIDPSSLIGSNAPVVEGNSVSKMTDAFRSGWLTADDIMKRVGDLGKAKRKAEIAEAQAAVPQAQLAGAQATAAMPLVQPTADVARAQLYHGIGLKAYQDLATMSPDYTGIDPKKTDGTPDFDLMAIEGNHLATLQNQRLIGMDRLKSSHIEKGNVNGVPTERTINNYNEDISPGSQKFNMYQQMMSQPLSFKFWKPGSTQIAPAAAPTISAAPEVISSDIDAQRARVVSAFNLSPIEAAAMRPEDVVAAANRLGPESTAAAPNVEPKATVAQPGTYIPNVGTVVGGVNVPEASQKLREEMSRNPTVQEVYKTLPQYDQLIQSEKELADPKFVADRTFDLRLAFNYFKSLHPETRVTEQNFKEVERLTQLYAKDIPKTLYNTFMEATRQQLLDPKARQSVIRETRQSIQGQVNAARDIVNSYGDLAEKQGMPRDSVVTSDWQKLLGASIAGGSRGSIGPGGIPAGAKVTTLSGGKKVYSLNGKIYSAE